MGPQCACLGHGCSRGLIRAYCPLVPCRVRGVQLAAPLPCGACMRNGSSVRTQQLNLCDMVSPYTQGIPFCWA